jgi:hypothetical protein
VAPTCVPAFCLWRFRCWSVLGVGVMSVKVMYPPCLVRLNDLSGFGAGARLGLPDVTRTESSSSSESYRGTKGGIKWSSWFVADEAGGGEGKELSATDALELKSLGVWDERWIVWEQPAVGGPSSVAGSPLKKW